MERVDELLRKAWEGEVLGSAFFSGLADHLRDDEELWSMLARVESVTAALIAPVAHQRGLSIDVDDLTAAGRSLADGVAATGRDAVLSMTLAELPKYLAEYEELGPLLPAADAWLGRELVDHEHAVANLMESTLRGAVAPDEIHDYLARHTPAVR